MKRRKGLFGRSKDDKSKKVPQQDVHRRAGEEEASVLGGSRGSLDRSSGRQEHAPSPLLVAKAARDAELSARSSLEASQHSISSGTIFVPVNEDSIAGSLKSSRSIGSLTSIDRSKPSPLMLGKRASRVEKGNEIPEMKLSSTANDDDASHEELKSVMEESIASREFGIPSCNYSLPPHMEPDRGRYSRSNRLPSVKNMVDELVRLQDIDFIAGERVLRLMRAAFEVESKEFHDCGVSFSFDAEDTFLSLKLYVEKFHACWKKLQSENAPRHLNKVDNEYQENIELQGSEDYDNTENITAIDSPQMMDVSESTFPSLSLEAWNELEQLCWDIYEHCMWCFATLAAVCVGPSWNLQLKERIGRIQVANYDKSHKSSQSRKEQIKSTNSCASKATLSRSNRQRMITFQEESPLDMSALKESVVIEDALNLSQTYPYIAEHLPISMLRFAAWFGEEILPPVKYSDTKVILTINANEDDNGIETNEVMIGQYSDSVEQAIWEERRSLIRRQRLAEAQRELTAALISDENEEDAESLYGDSSTATQSISSSVHKHYKLNIIGSHEPVSIMMSSWIETALIGWPHSVSSYHMIDSPESINRKKSIQLTWGSFAISGAIDWWNALQVSKTVSNLTLAGWRPPPEGIYGEGSILGLMSLAERGILLLSKDMKSTSDFNDGEDDFQHEEIREERMVAAATSAEATAALKHLGTRGCLPPATLKHIAKLLCYLLSITDPSISGIRSNLFPSSSNFDSQQGQEKAEEEFLFFLRQRESCLHEMAELLWAMMARTVSMAQTVDALFDVANISLSPKAFNNSDDNIFAACGAIRSLGASLWGNPPQINGNQSLRIYWSSYLDLLTEISSSIHERNNCCMSPASLAIGNSSSMYSKKNIKNEIENGMAVDDCFMTIPRVNNSVSMNYLSLVMIYEIVLSTRRLVDGDLSSGLDTLSIDEWGALISLLEMGLLPWLADFYATDNNASKSLDSDSLLVDRNLTLIGKIEAEVADIFKQLKLFLGCYDDGSYVSQRIVNEETRRKFYFLYFRMVSPVSPSSESVHIALSVIDSWVRGRPSTFNVFDWQKKCSKLLAEVFAFYDNKDYGYDGGYVHPPLVRQATMRALVESDQHEQTENSSMSSPGTNSGEIDPHLLSRITKNSHADTICKLLFPYLEEVLLGGLNRNGLRLPNPYLAISHEGNYEEFYREGQKLLLSALQIAGDLLRSPSVEKGERLKVISLLRHCALHSSGFQNHPSNGLLGNILKSNDWGEICKLKLEAVRQITLFLKVSFESPMPSCTLDAVKVLVEIVNNTYCCGDTPGARLSCQVLCISSMLTLACLRVTSKKQGMLVDENVVLNMLPSETADFVDRIRFVMDVIASHEDPDDREVLQGYDLFCPDFLRGTAVSSAIKIQITSVDENAENGKSIFQPCTTVNLGFIMSAIRTILSSNSAQHQEWNTLNEISPYLVFITEKCKDVDSQLKVLCYEILCYYIQNGLVGYPVQQWPQILPFTAPEANSVSQYKLLSSIAAFIAAGDIFPRPDVLFNKLLSGCTSNNVSVTKISCLGLSAFFSALSSSSLKGTSSSYHQVACDALVLHIHVMIEKKQGTLVPFISALFHVMSTYNPCLHSFSDRGKANIVILCHQICIEHFNDEDSQQNYLLSLQCASSAISSMGIDELRNLIPHISERQESFSCYEDKLDSHSHVQFTSLIMDLLVQYCLNQTSSTKITKEDWPSVELNELEVIAKDIEDIESFSLLESQEHNFGAWLLNDILLVCRIGRLGSVHQGWVEIILRSPSTRIRKLIRLSNHISLSKPELPSRLWETSYQNQSLNENQKIQFADTIYTADTRAVSKAKVVMDCCKKLGNEGTLHRKDSRESASPLSLRSSIHIPNKNHLPRDSNSVADSRFYQDNSFSHFLHTALAGDSKNIKEVEDVLSELDGSISILDSVSELADEPKILKWSSKLRRAFNILDRTAFLQTHKIALLFTGPSSVERQSSVRSNETRSTEMDMKDDNWILNVQHASPLFFKFCNGLGTLASLKHLRIFSGGMDTSDYASDGKFALCWIEKTNDELTSSFIGKTMVLFHAVPLMPPGVNTRKRHVGNDFVHIVFCEESPIETYGEDFGIQIISGEFCFVTILVIPICDNCMVTVTLKLKEDLEKNVKANLTYLQGSVVMPFDASATYVRQLAIRADLACRAALQDRLGLFSNWQERMQQIRSLQRYAIS